MPLPTYLKNQMIIHNLNRFSTLKLIKGFEVSNADAHEWAILLNDNTRIKLSRVQLRVFIFTSNLILTQFDIHERNFKATV